MSPFSSIGPPVSGLNPFIILPSKVLSFILNSIPILTLEFIGVNISLLTSSKLAIFMISSGPSSSGSGSGSGTLGN